MFVCVCVEEERRKEIEICIKSFSRQFIYCWKFLPILINNYVCVQFIYTVGLLQIYITFIFQYRSSVFQTKLGLKLKRNIQSSAGFSSHSCRHLLNEFATFSRIQLFSCHSGVCNACINKFHFQKITKNCLHFIIASYVPLVYSIKIINLKNIISNCNVLLNLQWCSTLWELFAETRSTCLLFYCLSCFCLLYYISVNYACMILMEYSLLFFVIFKKY